MLNEDKAFSSASVGILELFALRAVFAGHAE